MPARLLSVLVGDHDLRREHRRLLSLSLLIAAVAIASRSYVVKGWIWDVTRDYAPTLGTGALALGLVLPLYLRRILPWERSVHGLMLCALNLAITASLIRVVIGEHDPLLSLHVPMIVALWAAIALGWLGMRPVAALAWVVVFALGSLNLFEASAAMRGWGFVFLLCAFFGAVLQSDRSLPDLIAEMRREFTGVDADARGRLAPPRAPAPPAEPPED